MTSNNPPKSKWRGIMLACGTRRQRLYVNEIETPFFVDSANGVLAHRTQGSEHGLFGAGMHECKIRDRQGNPRYIAAILGAGNKVAVLKHRAEQMALARYDVQSSPLATVSSNKETQR